MNKYLITFMIDGNSLQNIFYFCEELPSYSGIVEKIVKEKNIIFDKHKIIIINIIPLKSEPNDLESKKVIKL